MIAEAVLDRPVHRPFVWGVAAFTGRLRPGTLGAARAIDVCQLGDEYLVRIALPENVAAVEIPIGPQVLRVAAPGVRPTRWLRLGEGRRDRFLRAFLLPPGIRAGELRAELRDGTLEIRIPA